MADRRVMRFVQLFVIAIMMGLNTVCHADRLNYRNITAGDCATSTGAAGHTCCSIKTVKECKNIASAFHLVGIGGKYNQCEYWRNPSVAAVGSRSLPVGCFYNTAQCGSTGGTTQFNTASSKQDCSPSQPCLCDCRAGCSPVPASHAPTPTPTSTSTPTRPPKPPPTPTRPPKPPPTPTSPPKPPPAPTPTALPPAPAYLPTLQDGSSGGLGWWAIMLIVLAGLCCTGAAIMWAYRHEKHKNYDTVGGGTNMHHFGPPTSAPTMGTPISPNLSPSTSLGSAPQRGAPGGYTQPSGFIQPGGYGDMRPGSGPGQAAFHQSVARHQNEFSRMTNADL